MTSLSGLRRCIYLTVFILFCLCIGAKAQQITGLTAAQSGKQIIITYNLTGKQGVNDYEVKLYVSTDGGSKWERIYSGLSGAVGEKQQAGTGKTITWDVLADRDRLVGDNIRFKITAAFTEGGVNYTETVNGVKIEMVFVKGGSFTMGCTSEQGSDCDDDEKPSHSVTLSDYYIGKYEVTQGQWKAVMGNNPAYDYGVGDQYPVYYVSWIDIQGYLSKLNSLTGKKYALPTEAQWEYAARGGNKSKAYRYSGSNDIDAVAWYTSNSGSKTHAAGGKQSNELGIYDMSGNVYVWCSDWYGDYSSSSQTNPKGPSSGSYRVFRGGGWSGHAQYCRSANRNRSTPVSRSNYLGLRLVCVP